MLTVKSNYFQVIGLYAIFIFIYFPLWGCITFEVRKIKKRFVLIRKALASKNPFSYWITFSLDSLRCLSLFHWTYQSLTFVKVICVCTSFSPTRLGVLECNDSLLNRSRLFLIGARTHFVELNWLNSIHPALKFRVCNPKLWFQVSVESWEERNWLVQLSGPLECPCRVFPVQHFHFVQAKAGILVLLCGPWWDGYLGNTFPVVSL